MKRLLLFLALLMALSGEVCLAATPTLVQHISGPGQEGFATNITQYNLQLPNVVGSNNALLIGISESGASAVTPTSVTDDKANSYGAAIATISLTNNTLFVYALCGITNGPQQIQVKYAATQPQPYRTVVVSEYYNVATAACVDTSLTNSSGSPNLTLTTGNFTPGTAGDLIWTFGVLDDSSFASSPDTEIASFTPQGSFSMLDGNLMKYATTNAFVMSGTGTCTSGCNVSTYVNCPNVGCATENWGTITLALKNAAAGTAPTAGAIHVDRIYHINVKISWTASTATTMIPRGSANLLIVLGAGEPTNGKINSVADGTNTWATPITYDAGGQVFTSIDYTSSPPTSGDATIVTWTYAGNVNGGEPIWILVVSNANSSPFDKSITSTGNDTGCNTGSPPGTCVLTMNSITPAQSNELLVGVLATFNNGQGQTAIGATPAATASGFAIVADSSPEIPTSPIDENDGGMAILLAANSTVVPTWTIGSDPIANSGTGIWTDIHALFKQTPAASGQLLRKLVGVGR